MSTTEKPGGCLSSADLLAIHRWFNCLSAVAGHVFASKRLEFDTNRGVVKIIPCTKLLTTFDSLSIVIEPVRIRVIVSAKECQSIIRDACWKTDIRAALDSCMTVFDLWRADQCGWGGSSEDHAANRRGIPGNGFVGEAGDIGLRGRRDRR